MTGRLRRTLRADAWWIFKIGPVVAVALVEVSIHDVSPVQAATLVVLLMGSAFGIGAFGHVVNDSFDVAADARAGKRNALAAWAPWKRALLSLTLLAVGFLPWTSVSVPPVALWVLLGNVVLLLLYAAPPCRLKEMGIWGVLADAAYAHLLPVAFVLVLFQGTNLTLTSVWTVAALAWASCFGVRGILIHQIWDVENDRRAGLSTYVVRRGVDAARRLVRHAVYPMELLSLAVLAGALFGLAPLPFWILVGYGALWWIGRVVGVFPSRLSLDPAPRTENAYVPLVSFYSLWPAAASAVALFIESPAYAPLLCLLIVLFPVALWKQARLTAHLFGGIGYQLFWIVRNAKGRFISRYRPATNGATVDSVQLSGAKSGERES